MNQMIRQSVTGIESLLTAHIERIIEQHKIYPGTEIMVPLWKNLISPNTIKYTAEAIIQEAEIAQSQNIHSYQAKDFPGVYIAVSVLPTRTPLEQRNLFSDGYIKFLNQLLAESGYSQGGICLVNWVFCYDDAGEIIHMTFLADADMKGQKTVATFAQDLMTLNEKRQMGMKS